MKEPKPAKVELLEEALRIITGSRQQMYGKPSQNFIDTANLIDSYLVARGIVTSEGEGLMPHDVAVIMICLKLARIATSPNERDHWVDIAGYAACGWEAVGPKIDAMLCNAQHSDSGNNWTACTRPANHGGEHRNLTGNVVWS